MGSSLFESLSAIIGILVKFTRYDKGGNANIKINVLQSNITYNFPFITYTFTVLPKRNQSYASEASYNIHIRPMSRLILHFQYRREAQKISRRKDPQFVATLNLRDYQIGKLYSIFWLRRRKQIGHQLVSIRLNFRTVSLSPLLYDIVLFGTHLKFI